MRALRRLFPTRKVVGIDDARGAARGRQHPLHHPAGARRQAAEPAARRKELCSAARPLESLYSTHPYETYHRPTGMPSAPTFEQIRLSKAASALVCARRDCRAPAVTVTDNISYFGIAWVRRDRRARRHYTSYVVTIDSITLTRSDGYGGPRRWRRRNSSISRRCTISPSCGARGRFRTALISQRPLPWITRPPRSRSGRAMSAMSVHWELHVSEAASWSWTPIPRPTPSTYAHHRPVRPGEPADHHAHLRLDERGVDGRRFRSRGSGISTLRRPPRPCTCGRT